MSSAAGTFAIAGIPAPLRHPRQRPEAQQAGSLYTLTESDPSGWSLPVSVDHGRAVGLPATIIANAQSLVDAAGPVAAYRAAKVWTASSTT